MRLESCLSLNWPMNSTDEAKKLAPVDYNLNLIATQQNNKFRDLVQ